MKIKIGSKLMLTPSVFDIRQGQGKLVVYEATVIYINLPHRFFRVRFDFPNGCGFTESYKFMLPKDKKGIRLP